MTPSDKTIFFPFPIDQAVMILDPIKGDSCIIQDATACCAQGIEFELADKRTYPDDYPEIDEEICVVGVFDTYKEGEYTYCTLRNAKLL